MTETGEPTADIADRRIKRLEARSEVDRETIIELRAAALVSAEHAANLTVALQTSRRIGAAIGILMATHGVTESGAFEILKKASQDSNRKLSAVAEAVVRAATAGRGPGCPSSRPG